MMEKFKIIKKNSSIYRVVAMVFGLILLILNLISVFYRIQDSLYGALFYCYLALAIIGLVIFVKFAFLVGDKLIFEMDEKSIISNIPKSKCQISWSDVSRVAFDQYCIVFYLNAEKSKKQILLNSVSYTDAISLMNAIKPIAQSKNINISTEKTAESESESDTYLKEEQDNL